MKLVIRKEAEREIARALAWYERQSEGLGGRFFGQVERGFERIRQSPELYPVVYRGVRKAPLRVFPYSIYYLATDARLTVLRVLHQSRRQPR